MQITLSYFITPPAFFHANNVTAQNVHVKSSYCGAISVATRKLQVPGNNFMHLLFYALSIVGKACVTINRRERFCESSLYMIPTK